MRRVVIALALYAAGCKGGRGAFSPGDAGATLAALPATPQKAVDANGRLDALVREHLEALLVESPTTATWLGFHLYDDRLDDVSSDAQVRRLGRLKATLERALALPETELDPGHRLDRALMERDLRVGIFELAVERPLERNPARYIDLVAAAVDEPLVHESAPLVDRLRQITLRLGRVRALLDESRKNLRNPPELYTRRALELGQTTRAFLSDTLPRLVAALGDERLGGEFRPAQADALKALDEWLAWLQKDLLAHSHGELALGRDRLRERLRVRELLDLPPAQLLTVAERELAEVKKEFEAVARVVAPGKSPGDAVRALEEDHGKAEDLLPTVTANLDGAFNFVRDRRLLTLPEARPRVGEMPPYLWGYASLVAWGPLEPKPREVWFYIEPVERSWDQKRREEQLRAFPRPQQQLTLMHEALPGHFVQGEAQRRAPSTMQKLAHSEAFVEGWAGYVEQMMLDEGFGGGDPKLRLAMLREQLVRLCRMVAVLRLHGAGAKPDDVLAVFSDDGYLDDYAARREFERVAVDPECLAPALGRLQIVKLAGDYRREKKESYAAREFHDKLLAHGAVPLVLLRRTLLGDDDGESL